MTARIFLFFLLYSQLNGGLCRYHISSAEQQFNIPKDMLAAIGKVESGKYSRYRKQTEAWPWTVYAQGKGRFFQTKLQAQQYIQSLLDQGEKNIDIGCMQINWKHHHEKFESIAHMLDPRQNVHYAGRLLLHHYHKTRDWMKAAGNYHSVTPIHHTRYVEKIKNASEELKMHNATLINRPPVFKKWYPLQHKSALSQQSGMSNKSRHKSSAWLK